MADLPEPLRRRLEEIFGDVLPATTSDERGDDEPRRDDEGDDWLRANRPPHHDQD